MEARSPAQRVIVAIDDAGAAADALDAAVRLAAALDARLTALFLENADLLRAAELPFLRETGSMSGTVRSIAGEPMARTLRAHAEQARSAVAAAAQASGLTWRFEVVKGRRLTLLGAACEALDLLVLGRSAPRIVPDVLGARFFPPAATVRGPVAVTVRDVPSAGRALRAAHALATACDAPLLLLLCGEDARHIRELRHFADRALGAAARSARCVALADDGTDALAAAARQHGARLLVCCDGDLRRDAARLDALRARLACPLVIAD